MNREAFDAHFDQARLDRLASLVALPDPIWTDELDSAAGAGPARDGRAAHHLLGRTPADRRAVGRGAAAAGGLPCGRKRPVTGRRQSCGPATSSSPARPTPTRSRSRSTRWPRSSSPGRRRRSWPRTRVRRTGAGVSRRGSATCRTSGARSVSSASPGSAAGSWSCSDCSTARPSWSPIRTRTRPRWQRPVRSWSTSTNCCPQVDVLSLHAPALPGTQQMIGAAELAQLPDHATVINTARGSLVDSAALAAECRAGRLFAILDVTDPEPLPADSPLRSVPQRDGHPAHRRFARHRDPSAHRSHARRAHPLAGRRTPPARITADVFPLTA